MTCPGLKYWLVITRMQEMLWLKVAYTGQGQWLMPLFIANYWHLEDTVPTWSSTLLKVLNLAGVLLVCPRVIFLLTMMFDHKAYFTGNSLKIVAHNL